MSSEDHSHEWEMLANIHNEGHKAIEKEIGRTIGNIRTEIKSATVLNEMWAHHLIQHTCSEAGGGTQVFLVSEQLRKAITARESLQRHTERFILLQSILTLKRQQDPTIPASINIEGGNIRETVTKHLKKLEENIGDMQYELKQAESLVNTERLCMDEIKKLVKAMDQKVRSIVPPSHHSTPAVMSPRQELEGDGPDEKPKVAGGAGPTLIRGKDRKRPISKNPSPMQKVLNAKDPAPQTKPLTDEEYMDWLIEQSNNYDDELSSDESAPPKQTRLEENIPESAQRPLLDERQQLHRDLADLEFGFQYLPKRKIGDTSRGVAPHIQCAFCRASGLHYSDSCPEITDGNDRFFFIKDKDLCQYCLENCDPGSTCKMKGKGCWYCQRVEKTILAFLIPNDGGHHRALCNIPNSKNKIAQRIQEVKQELARGEQQ